MSEEKSFLDAILESESDSEYESVDVKEIETDYNDEKFQFGEVESLDPNVVKKQKEYLPSYYSRNRDLILEKSREQRKKINQMKAEGSDVQNYSQSYYDKNKKMILEKSRLRYLERKKDPNVFKKYIEERKAYYLENKEKIKKRNKFKNVILNSFLAQKK